MTEKITLRGYRYSVYTRIVAVALHEKGALYDIEEIDPFVGTVADEYLARHPFGRVPVLSHGSFDLYETSAITRYIDAAFDGPALTPTDPKAEAQMAQIISIIDSYGYWPMIRQVFANRVFSAAMGEAVNEAEIADGMKASYAVLGALNTIATDGSVLSGDPFSLADIHLAPMMAYFVQAPEGHEALTRYLKLATWWERVSSRDSIKNTDPDLPVT